MKDSIRNNKIYLHQVQKFLDRANNIKDEKLRNDVIIEMLKCNEILIKIIENK